jgi:hypothetical protein
MICAFQLPYLVKTLDDDIEGPSANYISGYCADALNGNIKQLKYMHMACAIYSVLLEAITTETFHCIFYRGDPKKIAKNCGQGEKFCLRFCYDYETCFRCLLASQKASSYKMQSYHLTGQPMFLCYFTILNNCLLPVSNCRFETGFNISNQGHSILNFLRVEFFCFICTMVGMILFIMFRQILGFCYSDNKN